MVYSVSFRESAISSVSSIHKAIRDGDFISMKEQLLTQPSLLTEPNSIGWTTLHFCAASPEISWETWSWVLQRVPPDLDILELRTDNGQNCVDHFFRMFLNPLEWQRHEVKQAAKDLKVSIQQCLQNDSCFDLLQQAIWDHECCLPSSDFIGRILLFWKRLCVLLQHISTSSTIHALAKTTCPKEVALLALKLHPNHVQKRDSNGDLPLHLACQHEGAEIIMECLLDQASFVDAQGRLPLHIALNSGKTWENGIANLWNAYPQYGGALDIATGFPTFVLAAHPNSAFMEKSSKRLATDTCGSLWRFMPRSSQKRALIEAESRVVLQHLTTTYEILRAAPNVLSYYCL